MRTIEKVAKGLTILCSYAEAHIDAEHDIIWVGLRDGEVSEGDKIRLEELGWSQDKDADDSWSHFV